MCGLGGSSELENDSSGTGADRLPGPDDEDTGTDLLPADEGSDEELVERPRPWWVKVGVVILIIALVLFLFPWVLRLFIPPINPDQAAPPGHVPGQCGTCHTVTPTVNVKTYLGSVMPSDGATDDVGWIPRATPFATRGESG